MRLVLDTNILVSSIIQSRGNPALLIDAWLDGLYELVTSAVQLVEMRDVIERPRLQKRISLQEANELYNLIAREATLVTPTPGINVCRDPDDNLILGTAIAGRASLIATGDDDLLVLGEVQGVAILTARQALERLGEQQRGGQG